MNQAHTSKLVTMLLAGFPAARVTEGTAPLYERMLADLDADACTTAVERLIATARYLPTVAEIREATLALTSGERRPGGDAWGDVLRSISRYGHLRTPGVDFDFLDPVVARCVSQLGWRQLCDSECVQADRARFVQLYDELALQYRRGMLTDTLPAVTRYRTLAASPVVDVVANSLAAPRKPL